MTKHLEPTWSWLFDEVVPRYAKRVYTPRPAWRDKPFTRADAAFFVRGVRELSTRLTTERFDARDRARARGYLEHARFRSAYLLYFLPLQAAKLAQLFAAHEGAIEAALADGTRRGRMVVADLGAGPGTASLALLLHLARRRSGGPPLPPITLQWFDVERRILVDGREIASQLIERTPALRGAVQIEIEAVPWSDAVMNGREPWSLSMLAHTLNEAKPPAAGVWRRLLERNPRGGGALIVEPAMKGASQRLASLRDELFASGALAPRGTALWGPCLHAGRCPLASGRDWCHLSVPASIPGEWFAFFSRGLGSERSWLKYSYLWMAAPGDPAPLPAPRLRRVLSDPLRGPGQREVLICEPGRPARFRLDDRYGRVGRGDLLTLPLPPPPAPAVEPPRPRTKKQPRPRT